MELVVTIALLAIVSMISFVSINEVIKNNKIEQCNNLISSIEAAIKEYVSDNRYKNLDIDNFDTSLLNGYLTMPIINPYNKEEIELSDISTYIKLNDDRTVKSVDIKINGLVCE